VEPWPAIRCNFDTLIVFSRAFVATFMAHTRGHVQRAKGCWRVSFILYCSAMFKCVTAVLCARLAAAICSCPPCRVRQNIIVVVVINGSSRRPGPDRPIYENEPRETCSGGSGGKEAMVHSGMGERERTGAGNGNFTDGFAPRVAVTRANACVWSTVPRVGSRKTSTCVCARVPYTLSCACACACACVIGLQSLFGASTLQLGKASGEQWTTLPVSRGCVTMLLLS